MPLPGVMQIWCAPVCRYKDTLITKAKELKVSAGHEKGTDVGPVISPESKERVERLIESGIKQVGWQLLCYDTQLHPMHPPRFLSSNDSLQALDCVHYGAPFHGCDVLDRPWPCTSALPSSQLHVANCTGSTHQW